MDLYARYASVRRKDALKEAREGCLKHIVKHSGFDFFFAFVVLSNSIFIGVEVQLGLEIQGSRPLAIYIFQYAYTFLFFMELSLRLLADWRFYLCDEWMWTLALLKRSFHTFFGVVCIQRESICIHMSLVWILFFPSSVTPNSLPSKYNQTRWHQLAFWSTHCLSTLPTANRRFLIFGPDE